MILRRIFDRALHAFDTFDHWAARRRYAKAFPLLVVACLALPACELRRIKRDCLREIAAAHTVAEVDQIERVCHLRIERR
jgi:hypothetical protein